MTSYLDLQEGKAKEYLNLHEYAPQNGLGGPEFKAATSTPWNKRIYETVVKEKKRRSYVLILKFETKCDYIQHNIYIFYEVVLICLIVAAIFYFSYCFYHFF